MEITVDWETLKTKGSVFSYVAANGNFYIYYTDNGIRYCCVLDADSYDAADFIDNYQLSANSLV